MKAISGATLIASLTALAPSAQAAESDTKGPVPITGNVPILCSVGTVTGGDNIFDVGLLTDTTTGRLLPNLSAPPRIIAASYCNTRSQISISATPMAAQSYTTTPPDGFSRLVDYTATATGWSTVPASYATGAATNPQSSQLRNTAFGGDITVSISDFATNGGNALRLVSDDAYRGTVTVTLVAVN